MAESTFQAGPDPIAVDGGKILASWPSDRSLAMFSWPGGGDSGPSHLFAAAPTRRTEFRGPSALDGLRSLIRETRRQHDSTPSTESARDHHHGPCGRGFIVVLAYDLFRDLEPTAVDSPGKSTDSGWPEIVALRCEGGLRCDGRSTVEVGDASTIPSLEPRELPRPDLGRVHPDWDRETYERSVADVVERIRRGDCFQVNLSQRFTAPFRGSVRALGAAALASSRPRHGAVVECGDGRAVVSMSPELFLETRPSPDGTLVVSRPIKGTRPTSVDPEVLRTSEKDEAELAMIVDLMRNDLGRVCRIGSVRVVEPRRIETHETVHHGVAEVEGVLRGDVDIVDLLSASFPPGSITGAPKVQAMRIIDELEVCRRGPYCGAIGWIGDDGWSSLNVAIRTIGCTGSRPPHEGVDVIDGTLEYFAGCGIVADSVPADEYLESVDKTSVLHRTIATLGGDPPTGG